MNEEDFVNMFMNNICLVDPNVSLEAKGFYYSMLINKSNEDIEFIYKLIIELVENGYLFLGVKVSEDSSVFLFESEESKA